MQPTQGQSVLVVCAPYKPVLENRHLDFQDKGFLQVLKYSKTVVL